MMKRADETAVPRRVVAVVVAVVLAAGLYATWWFVARADREMRSSLLLEARLVAQGVNVERIRALAGTEADLSNPAYQQIKEQLAAARSAYPLCRFIYLLGRNADGALFFSRIASPRTRRTVPRPDKSTRRPRSLSAACFRGKSGLSRGRCATGGGRGFLCWCRFAGHRRAGASRPSSAWTSPRAIGRGCWRKPDCRPFF